MAKPRPIFIGIAGGSGSGKTFLAKQIQDMAGPDQVAVLSMDQYFKTEESADRQNVNFDHPAHLDLDRLLSHLQILQAGEGIDAPNYDFRTMKQASETLRIEPAPVVIVEGLFVLAHPVVDCFDLTCFLDVEPDERLLGRILRDVHERGATVEGIVDRYQRFVRPSYEVFVLPTRQHADVVVDFTFRRRFFTLLLCQMVGEYLRGGFDLIELVAAVRSDTYRIGYLVTESTMPVNVDIRTLAAAYPEQVVEGPRPLRANAAEPDITDK